MRCIVLLFLHAFLIGCTNSHLKSNNATDDLEVYPGLHIHCVARSPEVLAVGRLYRGYDDYGDSVYGTQLLDGTFFCFEFTLARFDNLYLVKHIDKSGVIRNAKFTIPSETTPLGVAYMVSDNQRYIIICYKDRQVGLAGEGPYRLLNDSDRRSIGYTIVNYTNDRKPDIVNDGVDREFLIAEKGFCINKKGYLLVPGNLDDGDIYK